MKNNSEKLKEAYKYLSANGLDLESLCKAIADDDDYGINKSKNIGFMVCYPEGHFLPFMVKITFSDEDCPYLSIYSYDGERTDASVAYVLGCIKDIVPVGFDVNTEIKNGHGNIFIEKSEYFLLETEEEK